MFPQLFLLNIEGQLSSSEYCFVSDHDMVILKSCINYKGVWNPIGEWKYDSVMIKYN